jgi:hypothetical protein
MHFAGPETRIMGDAVSSIIAALAHAVGIGLNFSEAHPCQSIAVSFVGLILAAMFAKTR